MGGSSHHAGRQANALLQKQIDFQMEEDKRKEQELVQQQEDILNREGGFTVADPLVTQETDIGGGVV